MGSKVLKIAAVILGVGCLLSCIKNNPAIQTDTLEILFRPVVLPNTKIADSEDKAFPAEQIIRLWAFNSKGESLLNGVDAYPIGDGLWKVAEDLAWKRSNEELTFYAASPAERMSFTPQSGISASDYALDEGIDLLYSTTKLDLEKGSSVVELPISFEHALASLKVFVRSNLVPSAKVRVKSLRLLGLSTEASFSSLPSARWSEATKTGDTVFWEDELLMQDGEVELSPAQYLIPHNGVATWELTCDIETGESVLKNQVLKADQPLFLKGGKCAVYKITIMGDLNIKIERDGI